MKSLASPADGLALADVHERARSRIGFREAPVTHHRSRRNRTRHSFRHSSEEASGIKSKDIQPWKLNIPADRIAEQPSTTPSGGMNAGTDTTATCSVWTGLESPWTLTYQWTADKGWKCTGISGPLEGAYTTLGDKTPDEKGEGEE